MNAAPPAAAPPPPPPLVLVVDDEPQIRRLLRVTLEAARYRVLDATNGQDAITQTAQRRPDLLLLDLGLPDLDGIEVVRRIREWSRVPVLVLSVREGDDDKVAALDAGADDYVTKPFSNAELLARIRAALRHASPPSPEAVFRAAGLEMDFAARQVMRHGQPVSLTPIEYALLRLLVLHAGKVLTHRFLLTHVWGPQAVEQTHYLRVHLAHLRRKLGDTEGETRLIRTESAVGYRFVPPE